MSSTPSAAPKRYWPFVAALFALAFSIHFLRREPAPSSTLVRAAPRAGEPPSDGVKEREPRGVSDGPAPNTLPAASLGAAPAEEVARNVVGALPQGEREAQRLKLIEVEALVRSGRIGPARAQAAAYFERWPDGPDAAALETLTGAHPRGDRPSP